LADTPNQPEQPAFDNPTVDPFSNKDRSTVATIRSRFKIDTAAVGELRNAFKDLNKELTVTKGLLEEITNLQGANTSTSGRTAFQRGQQAIARNTSNQQAGGFNLGGGLNIGQLMGGARGGFSGFQAARAGGAGIGSALGAGGSGAMSGAAAAGPVGAIASAALLIAKQIGDTISARFARSEAYVLEASQTALRGTFQGYGSRAQQSEQLRQPLAGLRLGSRDQRGINQITNYGARYGLSTQQIYSLGQSVEGLRGASGYQLSVSDVLQRETALAQPQTVNRMAQMLGVSIYGPGGKRRTAAEVYRDVIKRVHFTERQWRTGRQPGSNVRQNLENSGVPADMVDDIIDLALADFQYQSKVAKLSPKKQAELQRSGANGFFMGSPEQLKVFGVGNEPAVAREGRLRAEVGREEDFLGRQSDNYAENERHLENVNKLLGELEDRLSGFLGIVNTIQHPLGGGIGGVLGKGLKLGGAILNPGAAVAAKLFGMFTGDPDTDGKKKAAWGMTPPKQPGVPWSDPNITNNGWDQMQPIMKNRLNAMFTAAWQEGHPVWLNQGYRSEEAQKREFLRRYRPTSRKTNKFWDGKYWEKVNSGAFDLATPGGSMHTIGLAGDLGGDLAWVVANADRFGLKHFEHVNNEKHHVQPKELPDSRREYEKQFGIGSVAEDVPPDVPDFVGDEPGDIGGGAGYGFVGVGSPNIGDDIYAGLSGGGGGLVGAGMGSTGAQTMSNTSNASGGNPLDPAYAGINWDEEGTSLKKLDDGGFIRYSAAMPGAEIAKLLSKHGYSGDLMQKLLAISKRESGWQPGLIVDRPSTGDLSYGLFGINMLGDMGPNRRKALGIETNLGLLDPDMNIRAVDLLIADGRRKGKPLWHWGEYKDMDPMTGATKHLSEARAAMTEAGFGDPAVDIPPAMRGSGGGTTVLRSSPTSITVAPVFHLNIQQLSQNEAQRVVSMVSSMLEREVALKVARTN
jgi:D-alanyl-D-alanine carboxypeptidase